jgi:hypothetical protein
MNIVLDRSELQTLLNLADSRLEELFTEVRHSSLAAGYRDDHKEERHALLALREKLGEELKAAQSERKFGYDEIPYSDIYYEDVSEWSHYV